MYVDLSNTIQSKRVTGCFDNTYYYNIYYIIYYVVVLLVKKTMREKAIVPSNFGKGIFI